MVSNRPWTVADPNSALSMQRKTLPQLVRHTKTFEQKIKEEVPWRLKLKERNVLNSERKDVRELERFIPPQTRNIRFY